MKKYLPYFLVFLVAAAAVALLFTGKRKGGRPLNLYPSFVKEDKIPYGTKLAYEHLKYIFPKATIGSEGEEPGFWDSLSNYEEKQALIIVSPYFNADETQMLKLLRFIENGNDVFISAMKVSYHAEKIIKCDIFYPGAVMDPFMVGSEKDSLSIQLSPPLVNSSMGFSYPGRGYDFWFHGIDTATSTVLGRNASGRPNFIGLRAGKGHLYLHLAPVAFTNYFILHDNNVGYYETALSVISPDTKRVMWDEYFLNNRDQQPRTDNDSNWLSVLMNMENSEGRRPFKTAIWVGILLLLLYALMEMRRKQRVIPVIPRLRNDSLEFVKTIGRLYHDKGDHRNLSRKMAAYFLEHVRSRYKLQTNNLDESFITNLSLKTGISTEELYPIITFINHLDTVRGISEQQLASFHKNLESFYKKA